MNDESPEAAALSAWSWHHADVFRTPIRRSRCARRGFRCPRCGRNVRATTDDAAPPGCAPNPARGRATAVRSMPSIAHEDTEHEPVVHPVAGLKHVPARSVHGRGQPTNRRFRLSRTAMRRMLSSQITRGPLPSCREQPAAGHCMVNAQPYNHLRTRALRGDGPGVAVCWIPPYARSTPQNRPASTGQTGSLRKAAGR